MRSRSSLGGPAWIRTRNTSPVPGTDDFMKTARITSSLSVPSAKGDVVASFLLTIMTEAHRLPGTRRFVRCHHDLERSISI